MSKKFEQLLDYLVNEEMDKANELFHEIVVEKSREIYENMIAEEAEEESVEEADEEQEESVEEADEEQEESVEEGFGGPEDDETSMSIGGDNDAGDDFSADVASHGDDDQGGGEMSSGEEQIIDILQQLKSEFEDIVAQNGGGAGGDDTSAEPSFGSDDSDDDSEEEPEEEPEEESMGQPMREYVENVGMNWEKGNTMKTPGPVGSGKGDLAGQATETNTRSPVSSAKGKLSTTASAHNITQAGKGVGEMSGTSPNADKGSRGLVGSTKGEFTKGVQKNLSGSSKSSFGNGSALNTVPHGNKTGEGQPVGAGKGDKAGQTGGNTNTRSPADRKQ